MAANKPRGAVPPELTEALNDLNAATNETAGVVDGLRARIKQNMTPQEVQAVTEGLTSVSARLRGLAVDPDNPAPPPPP